MNLELANGFKKYAINTGHLFAEKILRMIVMLGVWAFVIRYLGPEQFGIFSYALSFIFLFHVFVDLGLDSIAVRDLVQDTKNQPTILGSLFLMKIIGAFAAILLIVVITGAIVITPGTRAIILIISLRLLFRAFYNIDFYFQSRVLSKYAVYARIISLMTTVVLCLVGVYTQKSLIYFAYVVVVEYFVESLGLIVFYQQKKRIAAWEADWSVIRKLFCDSFPLIVAGIAVSVYMRIDQVMIKQMLGAEWVGYYSAAVRVSEATYFIPVVVCGSLFPAIITAQQRSQKIYFDRLQALFIILSWLAIFFSVCVTIGAIPLVKILFGDEYLNSASVLMIHVWTTVFVFLGVARGKWAINENLQFFVMFYTVLGAVSNVILNFILLPIFSIWGAAFATIISQAIAAVFGNLLSKKTRRMFVFQIKSLNVISGWELLKGDLLRLLRAIR